MIRKATGKHDKGVTLSMRMRSTPAFVAAGLGALLLTSGAVAGPTVLSWDLQQTQSQERVRIKWTEPTNVQVEEFPAVNQVVVTIPGAELGSSSVAPLATASSDLIKAARMQEVTLADGRTAVRMTFSMNAWAKAEAVAGAGWLTVALAKSGSAAKAEAPAAQVLDVITLSNADIEAMYADGSFGSERAPATGAGQAPADAGSPFYVPANLTPEERAQQVGGRDIGMLNTLGLFERFVDLDFKNAELQDVVRALATKLDLNIIIQPELTKGQVTVRLRNVRLGDALDGLLKANGLAFTVETGGIVRIVPREDVMSRDKETIVQSVAINWVDASEVESVLKPFLTPNLGQIKTAASSNILILEDVPEKVTDMQNLISRIDVPEKQVKMEVRLVDMSESAARQFGFRTNFTETTDPQVLSILDDDGNLPFDDMGLLETVVQPESTGFVGFPYVGNSALQINHINDISIFGNRYTIDMELNAYEERNEAVTLANPIILSLNNKEAEIEIKRQIPYQDAVNTAQGSVATIKFQDIGTKIVFLPRITNNGFVQMEITPEQKIQVGTVLGVPIVDERNAVTSVIVRDEQTVALGGLRQFTSSMGEDGVPWLLRAPVIKWLFKNQTNRQERVELFLFVTPHIVKDPEPTSYELGMYEKIDYNWDLPDYYFDEVIPRKGPRETPDPYTKLR